MGEVYLIEYNSKKYVLKKVPFTQIPVFNITEADEVSLEAKQLRKLNHRYIVKYYDDFLHVEIGSLEPSYFIMIIIEYCPKGDLGTYIEEHGKPDVNAVRSK